jgi:hypothetical protein
MPLASAVLAAVFSAAGASELTSEHYICVLGGNQVVPPLSQQVDVGNGFFTLSDTNELSYNVYECHGVLANATSVHIHGPGSPTETGPILFTLTPDQFGSYHGVLGPLDPQQLRDLNCGLWYIDVHTAQNPWGEVRGRIRGDWGWPWAAPCNLPVEPSTWGAVKSLYR